ncbi:DUF2889 domain-containing protein [Burkholderia sp. Bp9017]|uniref:DUF2889 domain-containing protein n=1 Tax=unclassified Burkholderia TaxID=2613784 RepID=UPI000F5FE445|nr:MULTISPECIES: DUF2889 domain-containing protein [unclassified Burkholderia]RQZ31679.1 DUF2889 domain-containing protein [Burkholderia sp. Bp9017]RQZ37810.1 DUF2889 domain-containing protein [Burkholderia sp. Bp9016]
MPLSPPSSRKALHRRVIDMNAYARDDGLYDIEAHLVDTKPFPFPLVGSPQPLSAGDPLHDLWIRMTVDDAHVIRQIEAASDATPYPLCSEAAATLVAMVGERVGAGWSSIVKAKLRGAASCTHLMEMLLPMATTTLQAIGGARRIGQATVDPRDTVVRPDSCYAYSVRREVIRRYWPEHFRPDAGETAE